MALGTRSPHECLFFRQNFTTKTSSLVEVRREPAIAAILRDWRIHSGIKTAAIVRGAGASAEKEQILQSLAEEAGLRCEFAGATSQPPEKFLEQCCKWKDTALILPSRIASLFAFRAPEALTKAMNHCRIAFTGGPPTIPFTAVIDAPADLVVVDWQLIAEQIVSDLISKSAFDRSQSTLFDAQGVLRAPLNQYSQSL